MYCGRIYKVELSDLSGINTIDAPRADGAIGIKKLPEVLSWHHIEDGITMITIPRDLHDTVKHTGGVARIKERSKKE